MTDEMTLPFGDEFVTVHVRYRRTRHVTLRALSSGDFSLSVPCFFRRTSQGDLEEVARKLLDKFQKSRERAKTRYRGEKNWSDDYCFLFGEKISGEFSKKGDAIAFLKKKALPHIQERVSYYEKLMGVPIPYKVRVRDMNTRYGSNSSKTHALSFAVSLICYSPDIIDSVVVHELAHYFVPNHSKKFYDVVCHYDPDYHISRKKLIKEIHK